MSSGWSLMRVELGPQHVATGNTKHTLIDATGRHNFPPFEALEIVQFDGDAGFYLMHECADTSGADTWHQTLEDALHQAEFEFTVKSSDWTETGREYK